MNYILKNYCILRYNKRKKPWRSLKWAFNREKSRSRLRYLLYCCLFIEAALAFPSERDRICRELVKIYTVKDEIMEEAITEITSFEGTEGEMRERGVLLNLKEGELKFWQKVERQILGESH
ncbi:hypothetical protein BXY41_114144 [Lacrimispora xylanisolvens]|uniref:Uncharacterized protein n=1 Tax=Lacrimispora xylanisolvens TaxID=384636 RepID=A0A2S6HME1_9FIRM|nr:hypothetical protein [Hungatella xylanolytica]PPK78638.1 hypothetical protein BXY41_114144 [Hungatella xylanolytica]